MIILALLALFLAAVPADAGLVIGSGSSPPADFCSSCTPIDADVLCEDFEGANDNGGCDFYRCAGWSEVVDATYGSISCGAATGTTVCTDHGSNVLKVAQTENASNTGTYAEYTLTTAKPSPRLVFDLDIVSHGLTPSTADKLILVELLNATPGRVAALFLQMSGTDILLRVEADGATSVNGTTALSTGQHYSVGLIFIDSTSFTVELTGSTEATTVDVGSTTDVKYIRFGSLVDNEEGYSLEFDNIKIDEDTLPTGCAGGTW